ncbi:hypothetical protein [uncultured Victivallis sp.]|uniref:hypothetical protein n=1 Tax=uncultured Victivallis sp. TaxID=354118 RepID=UPI00131A51E2|nr:hypothetical protein [uncultured Victivallis sp.]
MDNSLKLTALQTEMLINLLKGAGSRLISAELLAADFEAGAPRNEDGTINLIEFAAWIVKGDEANANQSE